MKFFMKNSKFADQILSARFNVQSGAANGSRSKRQRGSSKDNGATAAAEMEGRHMPEHDVSEKYSRLLVKAVDGKIGYNEAFKGKKKRRGARKERDEGKSRRDEEEKR